MLNAEAGALIILGGHVQRPRKGVELLDFGVDFINLTILTNLGKPFTRRFSFLGPVKEAAFLSIR